MTVRRVLAGVLLLPVGVLAVVAGEADDSPGLQLVGVLLVLAAVGVVTGSRLADRLRAAARR